MPGKTPLVGWIKGYMVPELMGISVGRHHILHFLWRLFVQVCDELMEQRPQEYGGMKTYLKKTYDRVEK